MGAPETDREYERELRIKETLIREVHHRVKNNLQTIESLLRMQVRRSSDDEVRSALLEAITRIGAMAVVHEKLSFSDHEQLELTSLARAVSEQIKAGFMGGESGIAIHVIGEAGYLEAEAATSMALIIAETVHNAFEHGFADRQTGTIVIELGVIDDRLRVSIEDDGCGLDESFSLENTPPIWDSPSYGPSSKMISKDPSAPLPQRATAELASNSTYHCHRPHPPRPKKDDSA